MKQLKGVATVEAENAKEARSKVRESLYPSYEHILNDDLISSEKYEINPSKMRES